MSLQDQVAFVMMCNVPLTYLMDMDLTSFRSLHESCVRVKASEKIEAVWTDRAVAHADQKEFKKFVKGVLEPQAPKHLKSEGNRADFLRKFGQGMKLAK